MTATPHAGKEEDFQLFLALLDTDRFEGRYRDAVHTVNTEGLMRRMVKEDLKTFEGKPLFPERRAYTVGYELSPEEHDLYEAVTDYVRDQMNLADRLKDQGDSRRGFTVGFALTVLQRRLASSPEAILRSLERRHKRLQQRRRSSATAPPTPRARTRTWPSGCATCSARIPRSPTSRTASAATTCPATRPSKLRPRSPTRRRPRGRSPSSTRRSRSWPTSSSSARRVRRSGTDKKWTGAPPGLLDRELAHQTDARKIIIFTEHRDTLKYLDDAHHATCSAARRPWSTIHGGVGREERRRRQEAFTHDPDVQVLVATDAAGEGVNLQRAHLMVNYDLPWNPNRLEQRFGRIHRIGQTEVCHLWNLVAERHARGRGLRSGCWTSWRAARSAWAARSSTCSASCLRGQPLRDLLIEAIRYGNDPKVRAKLNKVIDASVGEGLPKLIAERAAHAQVFAAADIRQWRTRMDEANARRLQPHYIKAFFLEAFKQLGGRIVEREADRYEIRHVPAALLDHDRHMGTAPAPVLRSYERVTFDRHLITADGKPKAALLAPGHPLLDAVTGLITERHGTLLKQGTILVDEHDPGTEPRLLVAVTHEITDGHDPARTIAKRFGFAEIAAPGTASAPQAVRAAGEARYLDYSTPDESERARALPLTEAPWLQSGVEAVALDWAVAEAMPAELAQTQDVVSTRVGQVRRLVKQRLLQEINNWDARYAELLDQQQSGKSVKLKPETAFQRARDLEKRLEQRLAGLDQDETLIARPPVISAGALIVPQGLLDKLMGRTSPPRYAADTTASDRRAIAAVMAAEVRLGRHPREMPHNNPGYDIESAQDDGHLIFIEVKGRIEGAEDFWVTRTEALKAKNSGIRSRLALVSVSAEGPDRDRVRYIVDPFRDVDFGDFNATGIGGNWTKEWQRAGDPV